MKPHLERKTHERQGSHHHDLRLRRTPALRHEVLQLRRGADRQSATGTEARQGTSSDRPAREPQQLNID